MPALGHRQPSGRAAFAARSPLFRILEQVHPRPVLRSDLRNRLVVTEFRIHFLLNSWLHLVPLAPLPRVSADPYVAATVSGPAADGGPDGLVQGRPGRSRNRRAGESSERQAARSCAAQSTRSEAATLALGRTKTSDETGHP